MKSNKNRKIELLAPAGDLKKLKYALAYGADAVYLGLPHFSLRAKTDFDLASLKSGIDYAHKLKKKVYVTINIFAHERHLKVLPGYLKKLKILKPDAIILSDPGILLLVKKFIPKIPIHLSTQSNTLNHEAVKFWQQQGVSRIILGRETNLSDIKEIHRLVPDMELEVFVHGAMCMSYSGRCYLSAWMSQRSANEGWCTQPCRFEYRVYLEEAKRPGEFMPISEDENGTYIMNSKDLCLFDYLKDLAAAGVVSFKIEGRTKSLYYVSVVTRAYSQALEHENPPSLKLRRAPHKNKLIEIKKELYKIDNRGYTTGFLFGNEENNRQEFKSSKTKSQWQFVGEILETQSGKRKAKNRIVIKIHNHIKAGEAAELVTPQECYNIKIREIYNKLGHSVVEAHGGTDEVFEVELAGLTKSVDLEWGLIRKRIK